MIAKFNLDDNLDAELLENAYNENNYLIEYTKSNENLAVIYFSSHGIYRENTNEIFTQEIKIKNRFEWYKIRIKRARKHIFIRDILKQFYKYGINKDINSMDKLIEFLNKETEGMRVITVGSSAGGYMSLLAGVLLNAEMIFTFSPIVKLYDGKEKYEDLVPMINKSNSFILYFTPAYSKNDIQQLSYLKSCTNTNMHIYRYKSDIHGEALRRKGRKGLINSSPKFLSFIDKYFLKDKPHKKLIQIIFGFRYLFYLLK